jgi:hypothetical protein
MRGLCSVVTRRSSLGKRARIRFLSILASKDTVKLTCDNFLYLSRGHEEMNGGPSSSGRSGSVDELCVLFPQAERSVLEAILETEGSFDAAVEALLQSVVRHSRHLDLHQSSIKLVGVIIAVRFAYTTL